MHTIVDLVEKSCRQFANKSALRHKITGIWHDVSYETLRATSDRVAAGLLKNGFKAGDHAALLASSSPRWVIAYIGIMKAGGTVIPVDKELKVNEIRHILADSEARVLFAESQYIETVLEMADELPSLRQIVISDASLKQEEGESGPGKTGEIQPIMLEEKGSGEGNPEFQVNHILNKDDSLAAVAMDMSESITPTGTVVAGNGGRIGILTVEGLLRESPISPVHRSPHDIAMILYTSGTTGRSKGAMLSHANIVSNIRAAVAHFGLNETIHTLSFLPISHVFEEVCGILAPLSLGGTVSFCESLKKLGENLLEVKPTVFLGVPAVYVMILDRIVKNIRSRIFSRFLYFFPITRSLVTKKIKRKFGAGTLFISGGAALDPSIAKGLEKVGLTICQGYGITETSPVISAENPGHKRAGTVGQVLSGIEVKIDNPDAEGVGEILVKGPNVMQGYFGNPQATAEVLVNGWYRTGDLGSVDKDGFLSIRGRVKNLIVTTNGHNVYPEEVESELLKSPFIAEVMVYGKRTAPATEEIHASIYPDSEALEDYGRKHGKNPMTAKDVESLLRAEVSAACKGLATYKRVRNFTIREEGFPKTTTRKVKRFEVEESIAMRE